MLLFSLIFCLLWNVYRGEFREKSCESEVGLNCVVHYSSSSADCNFLESNFSSLYHREDGLYPGKPSTFLVAPIEKTHSNNKVYPGVEVTLKVPPDASFKYLKGFQLFRRNINNPTDTRCYIFSFNGRELNSTTKNGDIKFEIWAIIVNISTIFDFEVYSLPLPPDDEKDGKFLSMTLKVHPKYDLGTTPSANWVTTIGYHSSSKDKQIYIQFAKPPDSFNFKEFIIKLVEVDQNGDDILVEKSAVTSSFQYWFYNVQPGTYKVTVEPKSTPLNCVCFNEYGVCVSCIRTATNPMVIDNVTTTVPPTIKPTTTEKQSMYNQDHSAKIVAAVLGTLLGVVLVAVTAFLLFYFKRRKGHKRGNPAQPTVEMYRPTNLDPNLNPVEGCLTEMPTVFLVSAEDHLHHIRTVEAFANFLENNCQCKVIYAPWCLHEYLDGKFRWVIDTIEKADFVIIVNSELSYHQYKTWRNHQDREWKPVEPSQTFDLYMSSINQIAKKIIKVSNHFKCIIVHFPYTNSNFSLEELCAGSEYLIPSQIYSLMCQIHKMDGRAGCYDNTTFYDDLLATSNDGRKLNQCISDSINFEIQNPDWFNEYYDSDQNDSGIDSKRVSLEETKKIVEQHRLPYTVHQNDLNHELPRQSSNEEIRYARNHVMRRQSSNEENMYAGNHGMRRQSSNEENVFADLQSPADLENIVFFMPHQGLKTSDPQSNFSEDPPDFVEPSICEDEDVTSNQLRQEIIDLNNRMLASRMHGDPEEEMMSLGGQSV